MSSMRKAILRATLELGQRFRVNVTPNHFYSDIPDLKRCRGDASWRKPLSMRGVLGADLNDQLAFARTCCEPYAQDMRNKDIHANACKDNGEAGYGPTEADFLYCYMRAKKPQRIIQVGCGVSTSIMLAAARDEAYTPQITCIEPYPTAFLKRLAADGRITLLAEPMQTADRSVFDTLKAGDLLFIDSTHTIKVGSEVVALICEVIPSLAPDVGVHLHDINLPYDYGPGFLSTDVFFWRETVLLYALLINNPQLRIEASLSALHIDRTREMQAFLPNYKPAVLKNGLRTSADGQTPSSIYLRTLQASNPSSDATNSTK
jgi:Methyltransferase domain